MGAKIEAKALIAAGRRAGAARLQRRGRRRPAAHRLPAAREGVGRRRRRGHAHRARAPTTSTRPWPRPEREAAAAFGDGTRLPRALRRPRAATSRSRSSATRTATSSHLASASARSSAATRRSSRSRRRRRSTPTLRDAHGRRRASPLARAVGYVGAGTVEFLLDARRRVLVPRDEHPPPGRAPGHRGGHRPRPRRASSCAIADGRAARPTRSRRRRSTGHAIEVRLYAEDPAAGYLPVDRHVRRVRAGDRAGGARATRASSPARRSSPYYDPMLAKVIAHGATRAEAAGTLAPLARRLHLLHGRSRPTATSCSPSCAPRRSRGRPAPPVPRPSRPCTDADRAATSSAPRAAAALAEQAADARDAPRARRIPSAGATTRAARPGRRARHSTTRRVAVALPARPRRPPHGRRRPVGRARRHALERPTTSTLEIDGAAPALPRQRATATSGSSTPTTATSTFALLPRSPRPGATPARPGSLVAPMPGNVLRVLVAAGRRRRRRASRSSWSRR